MISSIVTITTSPEAASLKDRKSVVTVEPVSAEKVAVQTTRSNRYFVPTSSLEHYRVVKRIVSNNEYKELWHRLRGRNRNERAILVKTQGGSMYITTDWQYDGTSNPYRVGYGDGTNNQGWCYNVRDLNVEIYEVEQLSKGETVNPTLNVQSPNKDKTFRGNRVGNISDAQLVTLAIELGCTLTAIEAGTVTKQAVLSFTSYTAKDLDEGVALLQAELNFRATREAREELARIEAELETLKTREERQREANEKRARLLAQLGQVEVAD